MTTMVVFPLDGRQRQLPLRAFNKALTKAGHLSVTPTYPQYNAKSVAHNQRTCLREALREADEGRA
ncbi:MAG TPA: hypothetical protein VGJ79_00635 [Candidatus Dormibacteraeota bacterium]|jgi:hypothetical protein